MNTAKFHERKTKRVSLVTRRCDALVDDSDLIRYPNKWKVTPRLGPGCIMLVFHGFESSLTEAMDLREFTFRLVILFFPGLLAFMIFERLTVHKKTEPFFFVINSFVFGIVAYFCTWTLSLGLF